MSISGCFFLKWKDPPIPKTSLFQMLQKVLQITNTEILEVIRYHGACQLWAIVPHECEFSDGQQNGHNGVYVAAVDTLNYVMVFMWVCIMFM
jgi:hypothetical protein